MTQQHDDMESLNTIRQAREMIDEYKKLLLIVDGCPRCIQKFRAVLKEAK